MISFDYDESGLITKITELIDETTGNYKITEYLYDENQNKIICTKQVYDTKEIVEKIEIHSLTGEVIS